MIKTLLHHRKLAAVATVGAVVAIGSAGSALYALTNASSTTPSAVTARTTVTSSHSTAAPATTGSSAAPAQSATKPAASSQSASAATSQPAAAQSSAPAAAVAAGSNLRGLSLYIDPSRAGLPSPLNSTPVANWFGDWSGDITASVNAVVGSASARGQVPTLVAYDIPNRDCGSYSAGGAGSADAYRAWIRGFAAGIGARKAIVIVEPDALPGITCLDAAGQASRYALIADAVSVLTSQTGASVYLDAGNASWVSANDMAPRLVKANIAQATGFSLNVSGFEWTSTSTSYGNSLSALTGSKHFVIDTGRNGNGPGDTWCNPSGRALGPSPTVSVGGNVDAYLWIKVPGESDGTCNGGPSAGTYWADYANALIANRR